MNLSSPKKSEHIAGRSLGFGFIKRFETYSKVVLHYFERRERSHWGTDPVKMRVVHAEHLVMGHESFSDIAEVNSTVIDMDNQLFWLFFPPSRKEFVAKWMQKIAHIIVTVHFNVVRELIDDLEIAGIPHHWK